MRRSLTTLLLQLLLAGTTVRLGVSESTADPSFTFSHSYSLDLSDADASEDMETSFLSVYDGCSVSSEAFITPNESREFNLLAMLEEESDEEDPDDDDDDGHSSMLSNASIRRSTHNRHETSITKQVSSEKNSRKSISSKATTIAMMPLRGGATDAAVQAGSEVFRKLCTTALVTLVFEACMGHIFEFLKIVMQTSNENMTYAKAIADITATKGILALWDGFVPWGVVQAIFKGAVFGMAHATALQALVPLAERGLIPLALALTLAGGIGGGFQGLVLSPTLLLKTRVMTNPVFREKMTLWRSTLLSFTIGFEVVRNEGLATLMKGSTTFATKRVFDWASRYYFANIFEDLFTILKGGQGLTISERSVASLLGGVASTCVTLPLDVLVAKTQDAKQAGIKVSPIKLFRDELREKGLSGLKNSYMRGFEARLAHVCLTTVVVKTFTPVVYDTLFGHKH